MLVRRVHTGESNSKPGGGATGPDDGADPGTGGGDGVGVGMGLGVVV